MKIIARAISNWPKTRILQKQWSIIPNARAVENQVHLVACNRVGSFPHRNHALLYLGKSKIVNALGKVVAESKTSKENLITGVLTEKDLERSSVFPIFRDREITAYEPITSLKAREA